MQARSNSRSILLVEDNIAHIRLIQEAFKERQFNHDLNVVRDGVEAMQFLRNLPPYEAAARPDLILLDLNLPRKDGRTVLAEVKSHASLKRIPIVVLTTSSSAEDIDTSYDLHANCYIRKSRNLQQLFDVVHQIESFWLQTVSLPSL